MALTSPWSWSSSDFAGNRITVTIAFNTSTLALTSVQTVRDAACLYHNLYFGLGQDSTPNTSSKAFGGVPAGTTTVGAALLSSLGFSTITDVWAGQITAGP